MKTPEETLVKKRAVASREPRSEEVKQKIRDTCKLNGKSGGFREGGGKGKKGKFNGIHCDSSWELAFLIWIIEQGKTIQRVLSPRRYIFEGKKKLYYPDFIVDGSVYEIKGWKTSQWEEKHKANPDVIVLGYEELKPMIEFAKTKYGSEFTSVYE